MIAFLQLLACNNLPTQCMQSGVVALTIDEGPTGYTDQILDVLQEEDVLATFHFNTMVRGNDVNNAYARAVEDGHEVGFRTSPKRSYEGDEGMDEIKQDLDQQIKYLESKTDTKIKYARSPLDGAMPIESVYEYFIKNKIIQTSYSFNPYDDEDMDPVDSLNEFLAPSYSKKDSFIIQVYEQRLGEDGNLKKMIKAIKAKNYTFVTLSECLEGYKPGKTLDSEGSIPKSSAMSISPITIRNPQLQLLMMLISM
jgi:peptidoglycan/xylan/chitin deacetylase (PgdA/CDA1 family)